MWILRSEFRSSGRPKYSLHQSCLSSQMLFKTQIKFNTFIYLHVGGGQKQLVESVLTFPDVSPEFQIKSSPKLGLSFVFF